MKRQVVVALTLVLFCVTVAFAVPVEKKLFYQKSVSSNWKTQTVRFSLWDAESGGNEVWWEEKPAAPVKKVLTTYLGDDTSLDGVDFSKQLWVQVETLNKQGDFATVGERDPLPVVAYAVWSNTGTPGPEGPQGPQGIQGPKGDTGDTGPAGPQGLKGDTGETGPQGLKGDKGDTGAQGPTGAQGSEGAQGPIGPQGLKGDQGDTGPAGPEGPQGPVGPQGDQGDQGPQGPPVSFQGIWDIDTVYGTGDAVSFEGSSYISLADGNTGFEPSQWPVKWALLAEQGAPGPEGPKGDTGPAGPQGVQGPQGVKGDQGIQGPQGLQGLKGDQGAQGLTGIQGPQGLQGPRGDQGLQGPAGVQGPQGLPGEKGDKGDTGAQGPQGIVQVAVLSGEVGLQGGGNLNRVFVGNTVVLTTTATQRIVGAAHAGIGSTVEVDFAAFEYGLCYRTSGSPDDPQNFVGSTGVTEGRLVYHTGRVSFAAIASLVPGAGTWEVGYCIKALNPYFLNNNDYVSGWILVVN